MLKKYIANVLVVTVTAWEILSGVLLWVGNKALPALNKQRQADLTRAWDEADKLCDNGKGDCENENQIIKKVFRLKTTKAKVATPLPVK